MKLELVLKHITLDLVDIGILQELSDSLRNTGGRVENVHKTREHSELKQGMAIRR